MISAPSNIWSIPAGAPFLKTLARAVLGGGFPAPDLPAPGPAELSAYTILVPTRRAARELAAAFLNVSDGAALLLPRIQPLGDVDEEELSLSSAGFEGAAALEFPAAISHLRRQLILARLLLDWAQANREVEFSAALLAHPSQAVEVAADLGRLVDQLETEEIDLDQLAHLVSENFAAYWLDVLKVLDVVRRQLPAELAKRGMIGPAQRRNHLLNAEAARLSALRPETPYIAAGSTGSIPATANLLKAISRLPKGAVVLPGLDMALDEESWQELDPQHPQYGLHELLEGLGVDRQHVQVLGECSSASQARGHLLSETMRPSETTNLWPTTLPKLQPELSMALEGLTVVRAPGRREEALCIALKMREAAETPERTAALVTPDRNLGRRVSAHLKRWNLNVDDSAGIPLSRTVPGTFLDLIMSAVESGFSAPSLVALCAHRLARFGLARGAAARAARKLELAVLRGVAPGSLSALPGALERRRKEVGKKPHWFPHLARWDDGDWAAAGMAARMVPPPFEHLINITAAGQPMRLQVAAETIVQTAEAIAADESGDCSALWTGEAGEQLSQFFSSLLEAGEDSPLLAPADLRRVIMGLMAQPVVRPRYGTHPRLQILGLLEARMTDHDVVILGGLNEKTWPAQTQSDAWLNRPMRADLGLASPERRMGLSAHDFVQAACAAGPVYLTFSDKHEGAPAVPSRWLLRLAAILEALNGPDSEEAGRGVLASALGLDQVEHTAPAERPAPAPALELRPKRLSITEIETWLRDPYAIYARHILKLEPLEDLGLAPGPRERGMLFHEIFEQFSTKWAGALPDDIAGELERIGRDCFVQWENYPDVAAFWWPRFLRVAEAAVNYERRLCQDVRAVHVETSGKLTIPLSGAGEFTLTGRADRIDILDDGTARLIDYKTGAPPGITEALTGKSPQLLLEAVMLAEGAFEGVPAAQASALLYLQLSGGEPAIEPRLLDPARAKPKIDASVLQVCNTVYTRLQRHITRYSADAGYPYLPRVLPKYEARDMAYDHLSRYREWSSYTGEGEDSL
ncbi:MAG: double-strand break repair protein AddB [Rhizobiales bacterium]|nr:double-strand break repair protein AddB [Hyphomicrobiales bacterium]